MWSMSYELAGRFFRTWSTNLISAFFSNGVIRPPCCCEHVKMLEFNHRRINKTVIVIDVAITWIVSISLFLEGTFWDTQKLFPWKRLGVPAPKMPPLLCSAIVSAIVNLQPCPLASGKEVLLFWMLKRLGRGVIQNGGPCNTRSRDRASMLGASNNGQIG